MSAGPHNACPWCDRPSYRGVICRSCLGYTPQPVALPTPTPAPTPAPVPRPKAQKPPTPAPAPRVTVAKVKPQPQPKAPARDCLWPGCGRPWSGCSTHPRRLRKIGRHDPAGYEARWAEHLLTLGDKHAEAGTMRGKANADNEGRRLIAEVLADGNDHIAQELATIAGRDRSSLWRTLHRMGAVQVRRGVWRKG